MLPQKVLHVLNHGSGGAALSTLGLIGELRKAGIESCAVCPPEGSPAELDALREAVRGEVIFTPLYWWNRKIRTPRWKRPITELRQWLKTGRGTTSAKTVAEAARKFNADLIHTNTIVTPEGGLAALALGLPHVWHLRELVGPGMPYQFTLQGKAFGNFVAERCSKMIANSEASAACVRECLPPGILEVVPNGIDLSRFHVRPETAGGKRLVIGVVANLSNPVKRHDLVVEAAARVPRELDLEWRFVGHDPSKSGTAPGTPYTRKLWSAIDRHGLRDRFVWTGALPDPATLMSQLDVLVHAASQEGFGRIFIEAMASGVPTIGVRAGGAAEIILDGETGRLVPPDDPEAIAQAVVQLAQSPELRRAMGLAGRRRAEATYSLAGSAQGVIRVYEQAMSHPMGDVRVPRFPASSVSLTS